jgi:hypothetical protein
MLAGGARVGDLSAGVVAWDDRWAFGAGEEFVAPAHERHDGGEEVASGRCQPVFSAIGLAGVENAFKQAGVDECSQSRGERRSRDAEIALGGLSVEWLGVFAVPPLMRRAFAMRERRRSSRGARTPL